MLELFLGQIPEAIYFALFMIYAKGLKEKRILFVVLMVLEYLLLTRIIFFNLWFQILYTLLTFIILKILYKDKAQITDIFTFTIGSIILMLLSGIYIFAIYPFAIYPFVKQPIITLVLNRVILISIVLVLNNKLYNIQKIYKKMWNRNDKVKKNMKSATFRCINLIIFNLMFYIINIGVAYAFFLRKWGV